MRLNLTLDDDHAAKLEVLAQRSHVKPGTLARSLLLSVIDDVVVSTQDDVPSGAHLVAILDGIPGARDKIDWGFASHDAGDSISLNEL